MKRVLPSGAGLAITLGFALVMAGSTNQVARAWEQEANSLGNGVILVVPRKQTTPDPRAERVRAILSGKPYERYAEHMVTVSDKYGIDFRLLPSIVMAESTGGRNCAGHNCFGWSANRYAKLGTPEQEIEFVGSVLGTRKPYAGNAPKDILCLWNTGRRYPCQYSGFYFFNWI